MILTDIKILSPKLPFFMRNVKGKGGHKSLLLSMRRQLYILGSKIYMPSDTKMRIMLLAFRVHIWNWFFEKMLFTITVYRRFLKNTQI